MIKKHNYHEAIDGLSHIYLEDSYIIAVEEFKDRFEIEMLFVLTEQHSLYTQPKPDEQYSYKEGKIIFRSPEEIKWIKKIMRPITDKDNKIDYGNIDVFEINNSIYRIEGEFGVLEIVNPREIKVELL